MPLILTAAFRHIWKKNKRILALNTMHCFLSSPLSLNMNNQQLWLHERVQNRTSSPPQDARLLGCVPSRHHVFHAWKRANEKWARETRTVFQQRSGDESLCAPHTWDKEPALCSLLVPPASLRSVCTTVYYPCCVGERTRDFIFHHISTTDHFSSLQAMVGGVRRIKSQSDALTTVTSLLRSALE